MSSTTAIIFDSLNGEIKFYVLPGDLRRFQDVYINSCVDVCLGALSGDELERVTATMKSYYDLQDELLKVIWPDNETLDNVTQEEFREAIVGGAHVVVCGILL